jgi:hypothetical protein
VICAVARYANLTEDEVLDKDYEWILRRWNWYLLDLRYLHKPL